MSDFRPRPKNLSYRAKDGLYSLYLPDSPSDWRDLHEFIRMAIFWSKPDEHLKQADYRILDTFLTNAASFPVLHDVAAELKLRRGSLKVLLAAPESAFSIARGASINQKRVREIKKGLGFLYSALTDAKVIAQSAPSLGGSLLDAANQLKEMKFIDGVTVEIRYYSGAPSAPMYFLGDILVAGRLSYGESAADNPWWLVVKEPNVTGDLFGSYLKEFDKLWDHAESTPVTPVTFDYEVGTSATVLALDIDSARTDGHDLAWQLDMMQTMIRLLGERPELKAISPEHLVCTYKGNGATIVFLGARDLDNLANMAYEVMYRIDHMPFPFMRVGISRGQVSVGRVSAASRLCIGSPIRAAERLMTTCRPGEILITESYYDCISEIDAWSRRVTKQLFLPDGSDEIVYRKIIK